MLSHHSGPDKIVAYFPVTLIRLTWSRIVELRDEIFTEAESESELDLFPWIGTVYITVGRQVGR